MMHLDDLKAREHFLFTLEWLHGLKARHGQALDAHLIHVSQSDPDKLGYTYGAQEAVKLLVKVTSSLRERLRSTDLVARVGSDFWVLAPYSVGEPLVDKIREIVEIAAQDGLEIVSRDIHAYDLNAILSSDVRSVAGIDLLHSLGSNAIVGADCGSAE